MGCEQTWGAAKAPLTPEYDAMLRPARRTRPAVTGNDLRFTCLPPGMPRIMSVIFS